MNQRTKGTGLGDVQRTYWIILAYMYSYDLFKINMY